MKFYSCHLNQELISAWMKGGFSDFFFLIILNDFDGFNNLLNHQKLFY